MAVFKLANLFFLNAFLLSYLEGVSLALSDLFQAHLASFATDSRPAWQDVWNYNEYEYDGREPLPRESHSMIDWEEAGLLVVYGGLNEAGEVLGDLWTYNYSSHEINSNSPYSWSQIMPNDDVWIPALAGHLSVLRKSTNEMIVFGGMTASFYESENIYVTYKSIVWSLDLHNMSWSSFYAPISPIPRAETVGGIFQDELYIFGGIGNNGFEDYQDLWKYNFESHTWKNVISSSAIVPSSRFSHSGCIFGSLFVVFGGRHIQESDFVMLSDLWTFDLKLNVWQQVLISPNFFRSYTSLISFKDQVWLFGGFARIYEGADMVSYPYAFSNLFSFDGKKSNWDEYVPTLRPETRYDHRAIVTQNGVMYVYGGRFQTLHQLIDLISLNLSSVTCALLQPAVPDQFLNPPQKAVNSYNLVWGVFLILFILICSCGTLLAMQRFLPRNARVRGENYSLPENIRAELTEGLNHDAVQNMPLIRYSKDLYLQGAEESASKDVCPICLLEFKEKENLRQLPCQHFFHPSCVEAWLIGHANCPICKQEFDPHGKISPKRSSNSFDSSGTSDHSPFEQRHRQWSRDESLSLATPHSEFAHYTSIR